MEEKCMRRAENMIGEEDYTGACWGKEDESLKEEENTARDNMNERTQKWNKGKDR